MLTLAQESLTVRAAAGHRPDRQSAQSAIVSETWTLTDVGENTVTALH